MSRHRRDDLSIEERDHLQPIRRAARGLWQFATRRRTTAAAMCLLVCLLFLAAFGPYIAPFAADELRVTERLQSPNRTHLLGTDHFGRDILSRTMSGTRITLLLGVAISAFALCVGLPIGMLAGFFDRFGLVVMRVVDAIMAFPAIILALALMAILGKPGLLNVVLAVGLVWAPRMVRVVYSATLALRESVFVEAARALGASTARILLRHIAINLISPVIVQTTFTFAFSIMEVAALNFLGVGIPPYVASWGGMMNEGKTYVIRAPWIILFPGLFLATAVLSFNLVGDALRDRLDPKLRGVT